MKNECIGAAGSGGVTAVVAEDSNGAHNSGR